MFMIYDVIKVNQLPILYSNFFLKSKNNKSTAKYFEAPKNVLLKHKLKQFIPVNNIRLWCNTAQPLFLKLSIIPKQSSSIMFLYSQ